MQDKIKKIFFLILFLSIATISNAQPVGGIRTWLEEADGSPSIVVYKTVVDNGTLTDNADGTGRFTGGAGGAGDVTAVGDCLTGACFDGASGNTFTLKGATSGTIALKPTAVAGTNTITFPAETGTVATTGSIATGYAPLASPVFTGTIIADNLTLGNYSGATNLILGAGANVIPKISLFEFDNTFGFDILYEATTSNDFQIRRYPANATPTLVLDIDRTTGTIQAHDVLAQLDVVSSGTTPAAQWIWQVATEGGLGAGTFSLQQMDLDKNTTQWTNINGLFLDQSGNYTLGSHANLQGVADSAAGYIAGMHGPNQLGFAADIDGSAGTGRGIVLWQNGNTANANQNLMEIRAREDPISGPNVGNFTGDFFEFYFNNTSVSRMNYDGNLTANAASLTVPLADASVANNITLDNITQVTTRSHTALSDIGTNTHAQIDTFKDTTVPATYAPLASPIFTGTVTIPTPFTLGAVSVLPTGTELNYVDGVTSAIQTQIDGKQGTLTNSAGLAAALVDETGTGLAVFGTSPTFTTSLAIPQGLTPIVDAAGEIAVDTSATSGAGIRFYADATYILPAWQRISFTITNPTATADRALGSFPANITIKQIRVLAEDGTNIIGGLDEADANGLNVVAVDSDITATAGTTATDDGTLTNPTIDANDQLFWHTTSVLGTPTKVVVTVYYIYDAVN